MVFSRFLSLSVACASLFVLSACTSVDDVPSSTVRSTFLSTQSMGKGYKYQDDTPLSSPAPTSPWVKSAVIQDTEKMAAQNAAWQGAVFELVDKMEVNLPKDGTPLNLASKASQNAQNASLDHYLRQALIQRGYNLTTTPDGGLPMNYKVEKTKAERTYNISMSILDAKGKVTATQVVPAVLP